MTIIDRLGRLEIKVGLLGEAIASLAPRVSDLDPHLAVTSALERAGADGLSVYQVRTIVPTHPEFGVHFLLALADQVESGAVEQHTPGRFRLTADEIERRRESREHAKKQEELAELQRRRQAFEQTKQNAIDAERARLATYGQVVIDAAAKLGYGATSDGCEQLLRFYTLLHDPDPAVDRPRMRCTECGAEGDVRKLPGALKHNDLCVSGFLKTPAYATATR